MKQKIFVGEVLLLTVLLLLSFLGTTVVSGAETPEAAKKNMALNKPYTMKPEPNYALCTDLDDKIQLTDGQSFGSSWFLKTTVGWRNVRTGMVITIDLGAVEPIRGVSVASTAGSAGVAWPSAVFVFVSGDNKTWHYLGDLTALSAVYGAPPETGQASHRYRTDLLKAHGRYVQFFVNAPIYFFTDEIEVYRGEDAWLKLANPAPATDNPKEYFDNASIRTQAAIQRRLFTDLHRSREKLEESAADEALKTGWQKELSGVKEKILLIPPVDDPGKFRAIFPLNELHARIFAVYGALTKIAGVAPLTVWTTNRYDFLTPTQLPKTGAESALFIAAMKGETRSAAFNLTNATENPMTVTIRIEGLPGGPNPGEITIHRVEWTDTQESGPVAAALLPVTCEGSGYPVTVPAGMTRQVLLNFTPRELSAGKHRGQVVIERLKAPALEVPLTLRVFNETFPKAPALHVGGWDYTDQDWSQGLTPKNLEPLIAHLRERYVDTTWASQETISYGTFGPDGKMLKLPDTIQFDRWVSRWPGVRRYAVYVRVSDRIGNLRVGDPAFNQAVGEWITFWMNHAKSKGIKPEQILLLLVDEPHNQGMEQKTIDWAKPIRAAQTGVLIWTDPYQIKPQDALPEMWNVVDVVCPLRTHLLQGGEGFVDFYRQQLKAGRQLEFYSASGPVSSLDPYSYYRLQAWTCFDMGATGTNFWSFSASGKSGKEEGSSWNQYIITGRSYAPLFLGPDSVTPGKQMEAIRESVQDYQYLVMLRERISRLEKTNPKHPALSEAKNLLESACSRVLKAAGAQNELWRRDKDRSIADQVCVEIGEMLEKMGKL